MRTAAVRDPSEDALTKEFEDLFRDHYELIYRTAFSVTGSRQDAEDVLQTLFLRLLRRGGRPDLGPNPQGYLYRAAINLALNTLRARKRQHLTDGIDQLPAPVPASGPDPDDEIRRTLVQAIAQLRPRSVEILILHYEHEYTDAEIARMLGTSRGTVAVTLYRTRARLKKLMSAALAGRPGGTPPRRSGRPGGK
jgi:RNA polymerase sigma-70 factor (ECF subfamily)